MPLTILYISFCHQLAFRRINDGVQAGCHFIVESRSEMYIALKVSFFSDLYKQVYLKSLTYDNLLCVSGLKYLRWHSRWWSLYCKTPKIDRTLRLKPFSHVSTDLVLSLMSLSVANCSPTIIWFIQDGDQKWLLVVVFVTWNIMYVKLLKVRLIILLKRVKQYNQSIMTAAILDTYLCVRNSKIIIEDLNIYYLFTFKHLSVTTIENFFFRDVI